MTGHYVVRQERLKTFKNVKPGADLGVPTPAPVIEFADDATAGTYISRIALGDIHFDFDPTVMLQCGLWNSSAETLAILDDPEDFELDFQHDEATDVMAITVTLPNYADIEFTFILTPLAEGFSCLMLMDNTNAVQSVQWVEFPRLACKSPSGVATNCFLAHGFLGGLVWNRPHEVVLNTFGFAPECPPSMQFFDYFDWTLKHHLYMSTNDDQGLAKRMNITGDGSAVTVMAWYHYLKNPFRAHNGTLPMPHTIPYLVSLELFKGKTMDGRCGGYDAAIRYRTWATKIGVSGRPWMPALPWMDGVLTSDRVKDSDFYYVQSRPDSPTDVNYWTIMATDIARMQEFVVGAGTDMLVLLYGWGSHQTFFTADFLPQLFTPLNAVGNQDTALGAMSALNIHHSWYQLPMFWEATLTDVSYDPFMFDDFTGSVTYGNLAQYVIRDKDDAVAGGPWVPVPPIDPGGIL